MPETHYYDLVERDVLKRTWYNIIFITFFMSVALGNLIIAKICQFIAFAGLSLYIQRFSTYYRKKLLVWIISLAGLFILVLPFNIIYLHLDTVFIFKFFPQGNIASVEYLFDFLASYGALAIFSLVALVITLIYYMKKKDVMRLKSDSDDDYVSNMFSVFLINPNARKIFILTFLLIAAAFIEEVIYRYLVINIGYLPLSYFLEPTLSYWIILVASGLIFGYAHKSNGFIMYIFNSSLAGLIFAAMYMNQEWAIVGSFLLHVAWNGMTVLQQGIELKLSGY